MMKRILWLLLPATLAIGLAAGAVGQWKFDLLSHLVRRGETPDHAESESHEHEDEHVVELSAEQIAELGIEVAVASPGPLRRTVSLPGQIAVNADRLAHIVTRVAGVATEVRKTLGDKVVQGEIMAVVESRELADAKAGYLAARQRLDLAQATFAREQSLWDKRISSEQEFLDARQAVAETRIELHAAEQKLHALGLDDEYVRTLPDLPDVLLTRYEIVAPFDATVIARHITIGEALKDDSEVFVIADLSTVWVQLDMHQRDLTYVREGQEAVITVGPGVPEAKGRISYIGPIAADDTRTIPARVVLPNVEGQYRPGLFVTAEILAETASVDVLVPQQAVQSLEGQPCVFVPSEHGFEARFVSVGRSSQGAIEITSGLTAGEAFVRQGVFELKAAIVTAGLGSHAGHGH
ncbi:MAG: efflux RND transporter periplasmic adaptor subunit [Phycisphaerae bacterium]|nr:efflux RND transporter periplasmic adaptor subunit [Phycisphaerae bacterium]